MTSRARQLRGLTSSFGKDAKAEAILAEVNDLVAPLQSELEARAATAPTRPVTFVLGPPRGGTTLVSQLLTTTGLFGTVNNIAARFWNAPAFGLLLAQALGVSAAGSSTFTSRRGVTEGWSEPSEFGYFWSRYFDLGQPTHALDAAGRHKVDLAGLRRAIAAMESVAGKPMAFKNNTWFTFHADLLAEAFPGSVLVACRRDPFFVAQSIWLQRLDLFGDPSRWWSVRPPNHDEIVVLEPIEQVAAQAVSIAAEMERTLARINTAVVIDAGYERLVANPRSVVQNILQAVGLDDGLAATLERLPEHFESTDVVRLAPDLEARLRAAIDRWLEITSGAAASAQSTHASQSSERSKP